MKLFKLFASGGILLLITLQLSLAQDQAAMYKIQSLFLYNFTKHVKWSEAENENFTLGVHGSSAAYEVIRTNLESKMAWGREINVVRIDSPEETRNCHLVYVAKQKKSANIDFISQGDFSNTLLVTEEDLVDYGAAISFVLIDSKLNFRVNKTSIEAAGLKISHSLLSLAASA